MELSVTALDELLWWIMRLQGCWQGALKQLELNAPSFLNQKA
jgi:hypothetical protein